MAAPRATRCMAVLRILSYKKGTLYHGLHFSSSATFILHAYSDANWSRDPNDRHSVTNFFFLISWRSKKQTVTSYSSAETEYHALADIVQELIWIHWLLEDNGISHSSATTIQYDNNSAIQISHNDIFHQRTKHFDNDYHFVHQHVIKGSIIFCSVSSVNQLANVFTRLIHLDDFMTYYPNSRWFQYNLFEFERRC